MTLSKVLSVFSLSFIIGVFLSVPGLFLGFLFVFFVYLLSRSYLLAVFSLLFFLLGSLSLLYVDSFNPSPPQGVVEGVVIKEPLSKKDRKEVVVSLGDYSVLIFVDRHEDYRYGDLLKIKGDFQRPTPLYYEQYLKKEGIYYTSFYPETELLERSYSLLFSLKSSFRERMQRAVSAPYVFLLEAMIMGDRSSFTDDFNEKLNIAGVRHITAVSGMHIVIVSSLLFSLFSVLGFSRKLSAFSALFSVLLFVVFVGAPASAVRAGVMGSLLLIAKAINSTTFSIRSLIFVGAGMLLFNPLLVYDVGFHLSFLAVLGIILLFPILKKFFSTIPLHSKEGYFFFLREKSTSFFNRNEQLCDMFCVTLSAIIFTAPLVIYNFGNFPLFSVVANLIIVPLLPFIFVFGVIGAVSGSPFLAIPVNLLLVFIYKVIETISLLPLASLEIENISFSFVILFYAFMLYYINKRNRIII